MDAFYGDSVHGETREWRAIVAIRGLQDYADYKDRTRPAARRSRARGEIGQREREPDPLLWLVFTRAALASPRPLRGRRRTFVSSRWLPIRGGRLFNP